MEVKHQLIGILEKGKRKLKEKIMSKKEYFL